MNEPEPGAEAPKSPMTERQTFNLVADTVAGPNLRMKDNLYQGLAILVCLVLGIIIGLLVGSEIILGGLIGGFVGLLAGLFGSGIFLMIFRAVRHA